MYYSIEVLDEILDESIEIVGRKDLSFSNVQAVENVNEESLDWINQSMENKEEYLKRTPAPFVICEKGLKIPKSVLETKTIIKTRNPKLTFAKIVNALFVKETQTGIHDTAQIYEGAEIGDNVQIGPHTVIYGCVQIGDNVKIGANNTIGSEGYGYVKDENGKLVKFPHVAGVRIKSDVEIGNNTCIDRGSLSDTVIGEGTKVDNLVHIAHNVKIGKNCHIIATAIISGSVEIGDDVWIAPNSTIREHLSIGKKSLIGLGSVVTKSVGEDQVISGFPAMPFKKMVENFKWLLKRVD